MVKAIVEIDEEANKVINLLKAQYALKDKSQAINEMAKQYKMLVLESEVRPEYLKKLEKMRREPIIRIGNAGDFLISKFIRRRQGLDLGIVSREIPPE